MSLLFDRKATVTIGKEGEEGLIIKDLTIIFKIEKTTESNPNKAQVTIYNLNPVSRAKLEKPNLVLMLKVGYGKLEEREDMIFYGNVSKAISKRQDVDYITTMECGDGEKAFRETKIEKSYKEEVTLKQVVKDVIDSFGLSRGKQEEIPDQKFQNGLSLSGLSRDILDKLVKKAGLEWNIQDGELQIISSNKSTGEEAVVLTSKTGLIGSVNKTDDGVEFTSLLQAKLKPGRAVQLEIIEKQKPIMKNYRVNKVIHTGNSITGPWYSQCEAIEIG